MDIEEINETLRLMQSNILRRQLPINYETIELLCLKMALFDKKETNNYSYIRYDRMLNIVLDFFLKMDKQFYDHVVNLITNNPDITVYNGNNINPEDPYYSKFRQYDDELLLFDVSSVHKLDDRIVMYLPYCENVRDIYIYCHEFAHTFDIHAYKTMQRRLLAEITPLIFEKHLDNYLTINGYDEDVKIYRAKRMNESIKSAKKVLPIIILLNSMNKYRGLTHNHVKKYILDNEEICNLYDINNENYNSSFKKILDSIENTHLFEFNQIIKYVVAQATSTHFFQNYSKDNLIEYINTLGEIPLYESLNLLDVHVDRKGECFNVDDIVSSVKIYHSNEEKCLKKVIK